VFTYSGGKIINIKEENPVSQPGNLYDHRLPGKAAIFNL
jgi:hypothetical protein